MRPSEKYLKTLRFMRICAAACGADVVDKNYKFNTMTSLVVFCIAVYFIFSAYTVQLKFAENWTVALETFCMVGSVLQGISKLVSAIKYKTTYHAYVEFLRLLYVEYESKGDQFTVVLNKSVSKLRAVVLGAAILYVTVVLIMFSVPIVNWAITGKRLFVMQFYLPGLDIEADLGYLATIGMQSTCLFFGAFGNFAGDMFLMLYFSHCAMLADIFELKAKELNNLAINFGSQKIEDKLTDVIQWHQTYTDFIGTTEMMFFWVNFTQITTSALSMVLTLVIIFTGDWPGSYPYLCISFAMLFFYCGMGTLVDVANEKIIDEVYAIHWYILTVPQQKAIRFMLMKSQSPTQITVGGVAPLSVNTGLQVTKTVYSVFMMLLNFFD